MRRGAALAAAALVTLLGAAPSCKPSSLTPFTDWREPETGTGGVNGGWHGEPVSAEGRTGSIDFTIASDRLAELRLSHNPGFCGISFSINDVTELVGDGSLEFDVPLEDQGHLAVQARFSSETECSGTYFYEGIPETGTCPISGSGSFVATKLTI
jgi:hypothetical protein